MQTLIKQLIEAKAEEAAVKKCRVALEIDLATKLGIPNEGSKTHTVGDYKVTVSQRINRKVDDWEAFKAVEAEHLPFKEAPELDLPGLRWIAENDKDLYVELAQHITAKPGKPSVSIKETK